MISSQSSYDPEAVSDHYNELDPFYRELWGEHVHHGLWSGEGETADAAVKRMVDAVAEKAQIRPGDEVIDIGCGYGAPARQLVQQYGAKVTGITISPVQLAYAEKLSPNGNPQYLLTNWLTASLPASSCEAAIAIESLEHMPDREEFFRKAFHVLRVGGRFVVCAWLCREAPSSIETDWLLRPVCDEGEVPHLSTSTELIHTAEAVGFAVVDSRDCTREVSKTWGIILRRLAKQLLTDSRYRAFLLDRQRRNRIFALTVLRIWVAYKTGTMRYGIFTFQRPG